ncbi:MAG: dTDP-glucose 4,6-dehydratase [Saprospiraceae bacterium]|nr:dTDP-glucose 4,6-dehydratase [Saprospiraceae bacterium]
MEGNKRLLITGGAGFIGSHLVRLLVNKYPTYQIWNLDKLTYAGNMENLRDVDHSPNYHFVRGDITDRTWLDSFFAKHLFDGIIHLAAESHVDRSITGPAAFVETNVIGTVHLLEAAKNQWAGQMDGKRFYHVSTDEVYGSLGETGLFTESTAYDPRSPYSASKAASDHFVRAWHHTYGLPIVLSNCSNNYGPFQFPEKLIPLMIHNIVQQKPLPVYGDGKYTRDWLWVIEHAHAIDTIYHKGLNGETYNIGGNNEWKNIDLILLLCEIMDELLLRPQGESAKLITYVRDRPGHDRRYAIDASKLKNTLGWEPAMAMKEGLKQTARWYLQNNEWLDHVTSGAYLSYYDQQYQGR